MTPLVDPIAESVCPAVPGGEAGLSADFLRGMIDGMRCGVVAIDTQGRLLLLNEQACRILELERSPEQGTALEEAIPNYPELAQAVNSAFHLSSLPNRAEVELRNAPRGSHTIGFTLSLIRDEASQVTGAAMFFKDLTPIEHKAEQERLRDRLATLGQMAASMAHEIRNPLAAMDVQCTLLARRLTEDPECQPLLDRISSEIKRLNRSVDSCLQYVRPVSLELKPADLNALVEEAAAVAAKRRRGASIRFDSEAGLSEFLMDEALLRQVLVNLLLNALEAVGDRPGGEVRVLTQSLTISGQASVPYQPTDSTPGDPWNAVRRYAVVRVIDNGSGIDEETRDRMFDPFYTTKSGGSGVGLAVAKKIIASHRGMIDVVSAPGEGAEIVLRLPMIEQGTEESIQ
jgi:signal transduction histidine kinase